MNVNLPKKRMHSNKCLLDLILQKRYFWILNLTDFGTAKLNLAEHSRAFRMSMQYWFYRWLKCFTQLKKFISSMFMVPKLERHSAKMAVQKKKKTTTSVTVSRHSCGKALFDSLLVSCVWLTGEKRLRFNLSHCLHVAFSVCMTHQLLNMVMSVPSFDGRSASFRIPCSTRFSHGPPALMICFTCRK